MRARGVDAERVRGDARSRAGEAAREAQVEREHAREHVGGALAITIAGAMAARQDWIPPKVLTGALTGVGAALAVGAPSATARSIGLGVMASAGGQFGLMMIDEEQFRAAAAKKEQLASNTPTPGKGRANAGELPGDALARAYERARLRMAMSGDGTG